MSYTITVTIGADTWTTIEGDPADDTADVWVVDSVPFTWSFPDGPWPTQPDPLELTLTLAARTVADLKDKLIVGAPVAVVGTTDTLDVFVSFYGRVAESTVQPMNRGIKNKAPWVAFTVQCVDYVVDLMDTLSAMVTVGPWPAEDAWTRLIRVQAVLAAAGFTFTEPGFLLTADLAAIDEATNVTAFDALDAVLSECATATGVDGWNRFIIRPTVVAGVLTGFECAQIVDRVPDTIVDLLPGRVDLIGGLLTLILLDSDLVVDGRVELGSTWKRTKESAIGQVNITGSFGVVWAVNGAGVIGRQLASQLTNPADARDLADMLTPDSAAAWEVESLTWRPVSVEDIGAVWFPNPTVAGLVPAYVQPVIVTPIAASVDVSGTGYYAGQLKAVTLLIEDGKALVSFALRRNLPRSAVGGNTGSVNTLSWEALGADFPGLTWDDIDPALTWYDLRLARRT